MTPKKKSCSCGCENKTTSKKKSCSCGESHTKMISLLEEISNKITDLKVRYERDDVVTTEPYAIIEEPTFSTNYSSYSVFYKDSFKKEDYLDKNDDNRFPRNLIVLEDVVVIHKKNGNLELQGTYLYGEGKKKSGSRYKVLTLSNFIESKSYPNVGVDILLGIYEPTENVEKTPTAKKFSSSKKTCCCKK